MSGLTNRASQVYLDTLNRIKIGKLSRLPWVAGWLMMSVWSLTDRDMFAIVAVLLIMCGVGIMLFDNYVDAKIAEHIFEIAKEADKIEERKCLEGLKT